MSNAGYVEHRIENSPLMLSGYTAYALSNTIADAASAERRGITSGDAPYSPRYLAAVDSRLTSTTLRPAATPRNLEKSSRRVRSMPPWRQSSSAPCAATCGIIESPSAVHALRSRPSVSTRAAAAGPRRPHARSGAASCRRDTRPAHHGAAHATADTKAITTTFGHVA